MGLCYHAIVWFGFIWNWKTKDMIEKVELYTSTLFSGPQDVAIITFHLDAYVMEIFLIKLE